MMILEQARSHNLKLNKNKGHINQHKISCVSHLLDKDELKLDPQKAKAITEMPAKENRKL